MRHSRGLRRVHPGSMIIALGPWDGTFARARATALDRSNTAATAHRDYVEFTE